MRKVKSRSLPLSCLLLTLPLLNCGGTSTNLPEPQPAPAVEPPASSQVATPLDSKIRFRIVGESAEDPALPDPGRDLEATTELDDSVLQGSQLLFLNNLYLPNPRSPFAHSQKELFLVWPDQLSGSSIRNATYAHRALDHDHKRIPSSGTGPFPAWHDSKNNRWYIPLSELFKKSETYNTDAVELSHIQEVQLDFVPQLGSNQSFEVRFHLLPPFPSISLESVPLTPPSPAPKLVPEFTKEGWVIYRETLINPAPKSLHLWIKVGTPLGDLKMSTYLDATLHAGEDQAKINSVRQFNFTNRVSTGNAIVQKLQALHQDGSKQTLPLQSGQWVLLSLHPQETVKLDWIAGPDPGAPLYDRPADDQESYTYRTLDDETQRNVDPHCVFKTFTKEKTIHYQYKWEYVGAELVGTWKRELRISHDFTSQEFAVGVLPNGMASERISSSSTGSTQSLYSDELRSESIKIDIKTGTLHPLSWPHPMQGIFK